jgi:hypothetical protein
MFEREIDPLFDKGLEPLVGFDFLHLLSLSVWVVSPSLYLKNIHPARFLVKKIFNICYARTEDYVNAMLHELTPSPYHFVLVNDLACLVIRLSPK